MHQCPKDEHHHANDEARKPDDERRGKFGGHSHFLAQRFSVRVSLSYICDTIRDVERAISIRLDDDAQHALRVLTKSGRSQSAAVREALIALARSGRRADLADEAERLSANRADRAEKKRVAKLMESLRAAG